MARRIRASVTRGAGLAAIATLALAATARAGVVIYTSTDVPKSVDDSQTVTSSLTVPGGRPPITDLDVLNVRVAGSSSGNNDRVLNLRFSRTPDVEVSLVPGCPDLNLNITYDDQAATAFSGADCSATATRKPQFGPLRNLLHEDPADGDLEANGTWTMEFRDNGGPAFMSPPSTLAGWGLRITYVPMTFSASAKKQRLRKKLELAASCTGGCEVTTSGNAKPRTLQLGEFDDSLKVPLKKKVIRRLEDGGKARINLVASNDLGDVASRTVRAKVTSQPRRPGKA